MDSSLYKRFTVSRGYEYSYYFSPPTMDGENVKQTLLFAHGFPSTSADWHLQVKYFKAKGYGLLVPDLLGFGDTAKPEEPEAYGPTLIARDLLGIIDAEGLTKVIPIGHDWGSAPTSRLANIAQDRFAAFAFLGVGYMAPTDVPAAAMSEHIKSMMGFDCFGYWHFFASKEAPAIIRDHIDSFLDILWAKEAIIWREHFCPAGTLKAFLEADTRVPRADYFTEEESEEVKTTFLKNGYEGPTKIYHVISKDLDIADKEIPKDKYILQKPVLFLAAGNDPVAPPAIWKQIMTPTCPQITIKELPTAHWIHHEAADEVNAELENWVQSLE